MKMSKVKKLRKLAIRDGSHAAYVVAHAKLKGERGRQPSCAYGKELNPRKALVLAQEDLKRDEEGLRIFAENKKKGVHYAWAAKPGHFRVVAELPDYELSNHYQDFGSWKEAKKAIAQSNLNRSIFAAAYIFDDKGQVVISAVRRCCSQEIIWKTFLPYLRLQR